MSEGFGKLEIHVRRVASGSGDIDLNSEVYCPRRDRSMAVAICESCPDYARSSVDEQTGRGYVECGGLTVESARSLGAARRAYIVRRVPVDGGSIGERTPVSAVMSADVLCVAEDLELDRLREMLLTAHVSGVPVVNPRGEPIGVVSTHDLVRAPATGKVADVMTHLTFVLPEIATVSQAAALMALESVHRIPIVSDDGRVIGIVSSVDVLRWLAHADGYLVPKRR